MREGFEKFTTQDSVGAEEQVFFGLVWFSGFDLGDRIP